MSSIPIKYELHYVIYYLQILYTLIKSESIRMYGKRIINRTKN